MPAKKTRKCRICRQEYMPWRPLQPTCDESSCQHAYAMQVVEKRQKKRKADERKETKARKEKIKTRSDYMKEAQIAFNAFVRARDVGKPCICCGGDLMVEAVGGGFDCGHYRSVGSAPHLRFDERNAHGQRKQCNRYGGGRTVDYRIGLINRIGIEAVAGLESDNTPRKWSIEELKAIRDEYRAKMRELQRRKE